MSISYSIPLSKAWHRMKVALFQPFDLGKWLVVGFTAFLAGMLDSTPGSKFDFNKSDFDIDELQDIPRYLKDLYQEYVEWAPYIVMGIVLLLGIIVVVIWLSSRGKFMFLDNVVHNRAEVVRPWHEYQQEGDSLFRWRLVFSVIILGLIALFALQIYYLMVDFYHHESSLTRPLLSIGGLILLGLISLIVCGYISLFLDNFIVPIMYRHRMTTSQAWNTFLPVLRQNLIPFILYGLLILALIIGLVIGIIIVGFMTCCVGFIFFVLPYINTVVLLPVIYTFRVFSLEFFAQFGAEFDVLAKPGPISSPLPQ